ncbi:MAG: hypothetical protein PHG61_03635 [Candidatus Marinimicrobia bacterium]|nr:hypothetical protein [Candidatus Neomarinimicrobiota bacterium]
MTTRFFKATLEAISPSHSAGKRMTVFGTAFDGQVAKERAIHIGLMQGLGKSKVVKISFYKTGHGWFNAHHPKKYWIDKDGMLLKKGRK